MVKYLTCALVALLYAGTGITSVQAGKIEADPGKRYELSRTRGPWMISVATFHSTSPDGVTRDGKSPEQAAHELIIELRQLGMPAYMFVHDPERSRLEVTDQLGREEFKKNLRRVRSVLVLAGNYKEITGSSEDAKTAQESLKWIKQLFPNCLKEGVVFQPSEARPTPFSRAFLTVNPLLSPEDLKGHDFDPLLLKMNSGQNYSLFENKGEYTLVVATFAGDAILQTSTQLNPVSKLTGLGMFVKDHDLNDEGESAVELATVLRGQYHKDASGNLLDFNNVDAYVWHDRNKSIVTVGSFSSPNDPRIQRYKELFGPRWVDLGGGNRNYQPPHMAISGFGRKRDENRWWLFDPDPELIPVPKRK